MIVSVSRARIKPGMEEEVFAQIRRMTAGYRRQPVGERGVIIARRVEEDARATEVVAITLWEDMDAMIAVLGPDWQRAASFPSFQAMLADSYADHFETLAVDWDDLLEIGGATGDETAGTNGE